MGFDYRLNMAIADKWIEVGVVGRPVGGQRWCWDGGAKVQGCWTLPAVAGPGPCDGVLVDSAGLLFPCHPHPRRTPPHPLLTPAQFLSKYDDYSWNMGNLTHTMTNRRYAEPCVVRGPDR